MQRRLGRIFLLLIVTAWFGVAAPLHPRGVITMGGSVQAKENCCPSKGRGPESKRRALRLRGAICHFLATLDVPVAFDIRIDPLGLSDIRGIDIPETARVAVVHIPTSERGPPVVLTAVCRTARLNSSL